MKNISLVDLDVLLYAVGFAGQSKRYIIKTPDGIPLLDFKVEKVTKDNYRALTSTGESFHAHKRKGVMELMQEIHPDTEISEYIVADPIANVLHTAKLMLSSIIEKSGGDISTARLFLSGKYNFRKAIDPDYKISRVNVAKPVHFKAIRDYFIEHWNAEVVDGIEADDALGIAQTEQEEKYQQAMKVGLASECPRTVICTIDKDLDMIAGLHYNWQKEKKDGTGSYTMSGDQADTKFFMQLLMGDSIDDIAGIDGIGPAKAAKILKGAEDNTTRQALVINAYLKDIMGNFPVTTTEEKLDTYLNKLESQVMFNRVRKAGRLLWIQRHTDEEWYNAV